MSSAADDGDRRFGENENRAGIGDDKRAAGRTVGIGVAIGAVVFPYVLFAAEGHDAHRSGEERCVASRGTVCWGMGSCCVVERDVNRMRV